MQSDERRTLVLEPPEGIFKAARATTAAEKAAYRAMILEALEKLSSASPADFGLDFELADDPRAFVEAVLWEYDSPVRSDATLFARCCLAKR